jgi:hypothetical protein
VRYPVSGEGGFNLLTTGGFHHLARETFVQHTFDGLASAQYPKLFPELGEGEPDSQMMEAYVRMPYQQLNKVVFTGQHQWVT